MGKIFIVEYDEVSIRVSLPYSPSLKFAISYAICLLIGLHAAEILATRFELSLNPAINVICFCAASLLALRGHGAQSPSAAASTLKELYGHRLSLSFTFAVLAISLELVVYSATGLNFNATLLLVAPERYLLIGVANAIIGYIVIGADLQHRWSTRPKSTQVEDQLTALFQRLPAPDQSLISAALAQNSGAISTPPNSSIDQFMIRLEKLGLASCDLGKNESDARLRWDDNRVWSVTDNGLKTIRFSSKSV